MEDCINGKTRTIEYGSVTELATAADSCADREVLTSDHRTAWAGASLDETIRMAREGWAEELADAMDMAESAVTMADKEHMTESFSQPVWDVTGAQVDIGAFLAGTPECMIDYPLSITSKVGRVITLVASSIISADISLDALLRRGRVITALALALSRMGHAVEIWVDSAGACMDKSKLLLIQRTLVKGVNDELDPAGIMFALGHPALHRMLVIGARGKLAGQWKTFLDGAYPAPRPADYKAQYPEGTIFLPELRSDRDVPNADVFLRKHLGELGLLAE